MNQIKCFIQLKHFALQLQPQSADCYQYQFDSSSEVNWGTKGKLALVKNSSYRKKYDVISCNNELICCIFSSQLNIRYGINLKYFIQNI